MKKEINIYTDGSCIPNPGEGGWAWIADNGLYKQGSETVTTNNRMELQAVISVLDYLWDKQDHLLIIHTDSMYVTNGAEGFKKTKNIKNEDLWVVFNYLRKDLEVVFRFVKGHNNNPYNEFADTLANQAAGALSYFGTQKILMSGFTRLQ